MKKNSLGHLENNNFTQKKDFLHLEAVKPAEEQKEPTRANQDHHKCLISFAKNAKSLVRYLSSLELTMCYAESALLKAKKPNLEIN